MLGQVVMCCVVLCCNSESTFLKLCLFDQTMVRNSLAIFNRNIKRGDAKPRPTQRSGQIRYTALNNAQSCMETIVLIIPIRKLSETSQKGGNLILQIDCRIELPQY